MLTRRTGLCGLALLISGESSFAQGADTRLVSPVDATEASKLIELANKLGLMPNEPRAAGPLSELELADIVAAAVRMERRKEDATLARRAGLLLSQLNARTRESRDDDSAEPQPAATHPFPSMKQYYGGLARSAAVDPSHADLLRSVASRIIAQKARYAEVQALSGVPWYIIGCLHYREASLNFMGHLHNGDPLLMKTIQVPTDRPDINPWPPLNQSLQQIWRTSALDALRELRAKTSKWSIQRSCWALESYNGFGCYDHGLNTPYLWNYTNKYSIGGYGSDGHYSASYKSKQAGLYSLLLLLSDLNDEVKTSFVLEA